MEGFGPATFGARNRKKHPSPCHGKPDIRKEWRIKGKEESMIEVHISYDFLPGSNQEAYGQWAKKAILPLLKSKGIIELRAYRNLGGSPHVLLVTAWQSLSHWAVFAEGSEWNALLSELTGRFVTNLALKIWGTSPIAPGPLRPPKSNEKPG